MIEFELVFLPIFEESLTEIIDYFETEFLFLESQIEIFVINIDMKIQSLRFQPSHHQNITETYGFSETTYRINIGKYYHLFYQVDESQHKVFIGRVFNQKQMKINFEDE